MRLTQRAQTLPVITAAELDAVLSQPTPRTAAKRLPDLDALTMLVAAGKATQAEREELAAGVEWLQREWIRQREELDELREQRASLN
jgi:hypothetical protein